MKELLEIRAKKMLNKKYKFETYILLVTDYSFEEDMFCIHIDGKTLPYKTPISEADAFLDGFVEYKETKMYVSENRKAVINKGQSTISDLIEVLQENISIVRATPGYIPQAQVINKSVGQVINALRVEMEFIRLSQKK